MSAFDPLRTLGLCVRFGLMNDVNRSVGPLSTVFIISCAAWSTPQTYMGRFGGLFPEPVQTFLSFTIVAAFAGWAILVGVNAIRARQIPWRAIVLAGGRP